MLLTNKNSIMKKQLDTKILTELNKRIGKMQYYSGEQFSSDAKAWIAAIKTGRMLCTIPSVSKTGMSRILKFNSCEKSKTRYNYRQYSAMLEALGYSEDKKSWGIRVNGCGMDMVFHTNYSIIHTFTRLGYLTKKECEHLAQQTPTVL